MRGCMKGASRRLISATWIRSIEHTLTIEL
jgi:hypothetical protein